MLKNAGQIVSDQLPFMLKLSTNLRIKKHIARLATDASKELNSEITQHIPQAIIEHAQRMLICFCL